MSHPLDSYLKLIWMSGLKHELCDRSKELNDVFDPATLSHRLHVGTQDREGEAGSQQPSREMRENMLDIVHTAPPASISHMKIGPPLPGRVTAGALFI